MRFFCRGPRILTYEQYQTVFNLVSSGLFTDALHYLTSLGFVCALPEGDAESITRFLLEFADRRQGCGFDVTHLIETAKSEVICPKCGITIRFERRQ